MQARNAANVVSGIRAFYLPPDPTGGRVGVVCVHIYGPSLTVATATSITGFLPPSRPYGRSGWGGTSFRSTYRLHTLSNHHLILRSLG